MCKKNENQALLTKKEFVDIINRLRESSDLVEQVDLDYGRDYEPGCVTDGNGIVDMGTPEALYELLIHQLGEEV